MINEIVNLDVAKLAKKKGFNKPVVYYYYYDKCKPNALEICSNTYNSLYEEGDISYDEFLQYITEDFNNTNWKDHDYIWSAPTCDELCAWLRKKHDLYVSSVPMIQMDKVVFVPMVKRLSYYGYYDTIKGYINYNDFYSFYEVAFNQALIKALNMIEDVDSTSNKSNTKKEEKSSK